MTKNNFKLFTVIILATLYSTNFSQPVYRYTNSIFHSIRTAENQVYATAPSLKNPYMGESNTQQENLTLDIYQPQGDTLNLRPVVICAHGGGFIEGTKEHDDMVAFCDSLAEKGYVTVTINYRQGMNILSPVSAARAVYRGLQDSRAAIRYIKSIASTLRIDTNNVFFLGSSAGAFMAVQNAYMNEESERPVETFQISHFPPTLDDGPDLGNLDAIQSSLKFGSRPKAIVSLWGAVKDTNIIKPSDLDVHVLLVHGTADTIVPFNVGHPFGVPNLQSTYGSYPISARLKNLGAPAETYFVPGAGHEFYGVVNGNWSPAPNAYWDTVLTLVTNFLYNQHKPSAKFSDSVAGTTVRFNNLTTGCTEWLWNFGDGTASKEENPEHVYSSNGTYNVSLMAINQIQSWDTVSSSVVISILSSIKIGDTNSPLTFSLSQNYPNPFNPTTAISYQLAAAGNVTLKIYDVLGREVTTLVNGQQNAGVYNVVFNGGKYSSGVYMYKIDAVGNNGKKFTSIKKLVLLK